MKHTGTEFPFDRTDAKKNTIMVDRVADLQKSPKHQHSSSGFFFKSIKEANHCNCGKKTPVQRKDLQKSYKVFILV